MQSKPSPSSAQAPWAMASHTSSLAPAIMSFSATSTSPFSNAPSKPSPQISTAKSRKGSSPNPKNLPSSPVSKPQSICQLSPPPISSSKPSQKNSKSNALSSPKPTESCAPTPSSPATLRLFQSQRLPR